MARTVSWSRSATDASSRGRQSALLEQPSTSLLGLGDRLKVAPDYPAIRFLGGRAHGIPANLPSVTLTDYNPRKGAIGVSESIEWITLIIQTPCSAHTYLIAVRNYPIDRLGNILGTPMLKLVFC